MKYGCFYTHQGWTDIVNNLSLITYYAKKYDELLVIIREDAKPIIDYYTRNLENVKPIYFNKMILDTSYLSIPENYDILYHGYHDKLRKDKYNNVFNEDTRLNVHIGKGFYVWYDIPYIEKVNSFELKRDMDLEDNQYKNFIKIYGEEYIVFHDDQNSPGGPTGINLNDILEGRGAINLNRKVENIFSYLTIIKNAKEIHFVDSIWASLIYLVDCKYNFLEDKEVNIYSFNGRYGGLLSNYETELIEPIHKTNWKIRHI
jgi:hypothetical protein